MAASAVFSGARSMLRAASSRSIAASTGRFTSQAKSVPPIFRATTRRSSLLSPLRNPVEMSFCVEYHTATASALMTSMLSISGQSYGWLSDGLGAVPSPIPSSHFVKSFSAWCNLIFFSRVNIKQ